MKLNRLRIKNFFIGFTLWMVVGLPLSYIFYDTITKEVFFKVLIIAIAVGLMDALRFSYFKKRSNLFKV